MQLFELHADRLTVADNELNASILESDLKSLEGGSVRHGGFATLELADGVDRQLRPLGQVFLFPSEQVARRAAQVGSDHEGI